MRRKIYLLILLAAIIWVASFFLSFVLFVTLTIIGFWGICILIAFLVANKLIKHTNWWKNQYLATKQFVSNAGYRDNIIRNYDIVNLGSNPAHFAFFYQEVKGQSWATGSQGQDMDFEILKYFHSYIKEGGTILIPIMPFTAISPFIKERPEYWGLSYYSKFAKILDFHQISQLPYGDKKIMHYLKYPLLFNLRAIFYLFHDCKPDERYQISEQPMMKMDLEQDAVNWMDGWAKEFCLKSIYDVLDPRWEKYYKEAVLLNRNIVDFCLERGYNPVLICVPMTKYLSDKFPQDVKKYLIEDFVHKVNIHNIPFLDYTLCKEFKDPDLYFNSFFLNMKGRKKFTQRVLSDLGIYTKDGQ